jgi:hypothetical protein
MSSVQRGVGRLADTLAAVTALPERRVRLVSWAVLSMPMAVMAIALLGRGWNPVLDLAMTEFRVRDVGGRHTPLIGLPGRIGRFPDQGSHPGPASFYLLAPVYRLLGSTAWGLLVAMIVLNVVAIGLLLWIAGRRGGTPLVLVAAVVVAVVQRGYGTEVLEQPWNPYLPVLFWAVVLLAVWSVLDGDVAMLVVVAAAGSLCAQTHVPYLPLAIGMTAVAFAGAVRLWRRSPAQRAEVQRCVLWSVVVAAVMWLPVLIDQVVNDPGNVRMLVRHFSSPPADEPVVGLGEGVRLVVRHLDVVRLARFALQGDEYFVRAGYRLDGATAAGFVVLVLWAASAVLAWRMRHRLLVALHAVVAVSLAFATASISRIFGKVWYYLTLWLWATTVLLVVAAVATGVAWLRQRRSASAGDASRRARVAGAALLGVLGVASVTAFTIDAARAQVPEEHLSDTLAALVPQTVTALEDGAGGATGAAGRYTVTYADSYYFGSQSYGLVSELERRGFDVGMPTTWRVPVTPHRVVLEADATAQLRLATGRYIDEVEALPGAVQIAFHDPRGPADIARGEFLADQVRSSLVALGLDELVPRIDDNLFGLQLDERVPPDVQEMVDELLHLGAPTAVFVLPPETGT